MLDLIIQSIKDTAKGVNEHVDYPTCPGIYAFILKENSTLKDFGKPSQVLYVGIAKQSLKKRDLENHFHNKSTGRSTLRRSLGAILKEEFNLTAFSRNGTDSKKEILNYRFNSDGEQLLTSWMCDNLVVGYWKDEQLIPYSKLRDLEEEVIKLLKPTLDLDPRTKKYNVLASDLDRLRLICRAEAQNVIE